MDRGELLYREIVSAFTDRAYLSSRGIRKSQMQERLPDLRYLADMILSYSDKNGRIKAEKILKAGAVCLKEMSLTPEQGWALHCYLYIRGVIYPHLGIPEEAEEFLAEVRAAFPEFTEIHMDPLSLSVSCHIGQGAIAIAAAKCASE